LEKDATALELEMDTTALELEMEIDVSQEISKLKLLLMGQHQ
jgi:hypothetical protein